MRLQAKPLPPKLERQKGENRDSQLIGTETHEQKPLWEQVLEKENLDCNWQIAGGSVWTVPRVKNPRGDEVIGSSQHFYKFYLQKLYQVLTVKSGEKNPLSF